MTFRLWWTRLLSFFRIVFRKRKLLPEPETELVPAEEKAPVATSAEFESYARAETSIEAAPENGPVIEVQSDADASLPSAMVPLALPGAEAVAALAEGPSPVMPGAEFQPYAQAQAVDQQPRQAAALPPATIPSPPPDPPAYAEWMRARAMYFAPATYSPAPGVDRVLAPDLLFRLGADTRRVITDTRMRTWEPPAAPPLKPKPVPRLMDDFTTSAETEPQANGQGRVGNVDPLLLSLFLSAHEGAPDTPPEAVAEYLKEPALLARATELRDLVVEHWRSGGAPLSALALYEMARAGITHPGTALLLCHNVIKAFSRGGEAIRWQAANRTRGEYTDGKSTYVATLLHRDGTLRTGPFAGPSIFYVLFSSSEFAGADPGDYYRFFAAATVAWYAAAKQARVPAVAATRSAEQIAQSIVDRARRMAEGSQEQTPAYRGWLWANALRLGSCGVCLRGAVFGLREAGAEPNAGWATCSDAVPPATLQLNRATIAQILGSGSPHLRRSPGGASFSLLCTVEEGAACRFTSSDWADQTLTPQAAGIIEGLGWSAVEQSARRQIVLRCYVPGSDPAKARCECDRGQGFEPLEVS